MVSTARFFFFTLGFLNNEYFFNSSIIDAFTAENTSIEFSNFVKHNNQYHLLSYHHCYEYS